MAHIGAPHCGTKNRLRNQHAPGNRDDFGFPLLAPRNPERQQQQNSHDGQGRLQLARPCRPARIGIHRRIGVGAGGKVDKKGNSEQNNEPRKLGRPCTHVCVLMPVPLTHQREHHQQPERQKRRQETARARSRSSPERAFRRSALRATRKLPRPAPWTRPKALAGTIPLSTRGPRRRP